MYKSLSIFLSMGLAAISLANVSPVTLTSAKNEIKFEVAPTPNADHVHIYVDNKDPEIVRKLKGSFSLEKLSKGTHDICVKVSDKNHALLAGAEKCLKVSVQ